MRKRTIRRFDESATAWPHRAEEPRGLSRHPSPPAAEATPRKIAARRPTTSRSSNPANCLFVNQIGDRIAGIVRLVKAGAGTARILVFRVDPEWYHTAVVTDLLRSVQDHCRRYGCFRVLVDFSVAPPWMSNILRSHGFRVRWHHRTWEAILASSTPSTPRSVPLRLAANLRTSPSLGEAN